MQVYEPKDAAELAEIVAALAAPVRIRGGGTRAVGQGSASDVLDLSAINGIVDYEPGALTLIAKAGTPLAQIETLLAGENQRLAFEPMDHRPLLGTTGAPTLGGAFAANVSGPRRIAVGACRDFALGVKFVDGAGRLLQNGGRVMKNVTGYDLVRLMAGSWGTLGAVHEVSLKVMPAPETEATLAFDTPDTAAALENMSGALGSPYEASGAAYAPGRGKTYLRLEGFETSVLYRAGELQARLGDAEILREEMSRAVWRDLRDARDFSGAAYVAKVSVRPAHLPELAARLSGPWLADWGGGLVWVSGEAEEAAGLTDALRDFVANKGGHCTVVKAPPGADMALFQPEAPAVARLTEGVRRRFDPHGVFNPGLMVGA